MVKMRTANVQRQTKETTIDLHVNLDDPSETTIETGVPFFTHVLEAFSLHGGIGMRLAVRSDGNPHHVVEDVGIALGMALKNVIEDTVGIRRFGSASIPMDDSLATIAVDAAGRSYVVFNATIVQTTITLSRLYSKRSGSHSAKRCSRERESEAQRECYSHFGCPRPIRR
jgi:imidazoleglycerol phosphate dehydratase HisB